MLSRCRSAIWTSIIAIVLATFTILFGARHNDATEHQRGLMLAIAVELIVKISAFLLVGIYVVYGMNNGRAI